MASDHESHGEDISADNITPAADAAPEVAPVKKATRRRATRPAKTAAPAVETVDVASALAEIQLPPAQDELPDAEPAAEAAPRRRARKRTAPRAAPRTGAADGTGPTEAGPESSPDTAATDAAVADIAATETAAIDTGAAEPEQEAPAAPVKAARRTRRKAVSPAQAPAAADPAADIAGVDTSAVDTSAVDAFALEAAALDPAPVAEPVSVVDPLDDDEAAAAPVVPMPLFQAPEPVRRPRRAASRPAGPPKQAVGEDAPVDAPAEVAAAPADEQPTAPGIEDDAEESEAIVVPGLDDLSDDLTGDLTADLDATDATDEDEQDAEDGDQPRRRRRRGGRGRRGRTRAEGDEPGDGTAEGAAAGEPAAPVESSDAESAEGEPAEADDEEGEEAGESSGSSRRRRRRRRRGSSSGEAEASEDPPNTVTRVRETRETRERGRSSSSDEATGIKGSTRLEAKKQRRREGREVGRRRQVISEAEFLARRESVERVMVVRENDGRTQIGVLEDGVLVEHYVARKTQTSMVGNVYLGRVQNVLPSMEAAFIDIGKGRNAVLYAGEVNWDQAGLDGQPRRIENALKAGEPVLVQVTKDPIGHKGARLTSQISMPGRYLVYVPEGSMTGISRKLPENERARLKKVLKAVVPDHAGVIVRTAAEGASDVELERDVARLQAQWDDIDKKVAGGNAPTMLYSEPDLAIRVVRDIFNEDFSSLIISGDDAWDTLQGYIGHVAPDLVERVSRWDGKGDVFAAKRIDEQLHKAMDRKVWLPSGGSLVIDRTEAMTVVDVNTGKFTGSGGSNLEETVTKNNLEAVEEVVRQLRLRDIGGIIVVDFIDMVLESNRDLVLRRLLECLGRDRTRHQVAEVTSLGLVQMTRKRVGQGLVEVFSETCEHCGGRGIIVHDEPVEKKQDNGGGGNGRRGKN